MSGFQSAPGAYEALRSGNVDLMKVRFNEHYKATFDKHQEFVARRRSVSGGQDA